MKYGNKLGGIVRRFLSGESVVKMEERLINCDADPLVPKGWEVEEHKKDGQFAFDPTKVKFYLSPNQQNGKSIEGNKLRKELAGKKVLNANVLDYLLAHPELIPENWKKDENGKTRCIFFWGTIYRDPYGLLHVRYLDWDGVRWVRHSSWLDLDWSGDSPAAVKEVANLRPVQKCAGLFNF